LLLVSDHQEAPEQATIMCSVVGDGPGSLCWVSEGLAHRGQNKGLQCFSCHSQTRLQKGVMEPVLSGKPWHPTEWTGMSSK
jgi:hypothetical protein